MIISALKIISIAQLAFSTSSSTSVSVSASSSASTSSASTSSASTSSASTSSASTSSDSSTSSASTSSTSTSSASTSSASTSSAVSTSSSSSTSVSASSSSSSSSQSSSSSASSCSSSSSSESASSSSSSQSASSQADCDMPKFTDSDGNTVYCWEEWTDPNSDRPDLTFEVSQENISIEHRRNGVIADRDVIKTRGFWNLIWHGLTLAQTQSLQTYTEFDFFRFYPDGQQQTYFQVFCPQSNGWKTSVERGGTYTVTMLLREFDITKSSSSSSSSQSSSSSSSSQ